MTTFGDADEKACDGSASSQIVRRNFKWDASQIATPAWRYDGQLQPNAGDTVKAAPLLAWLETVTTIFPLVAPAGTWTVIAVALHETTGIAVPLSFTVLVPFVVPRFVPVITMPICTGPWVSERLVMPAVTVKVFELLGTPLSVTITGPVVADAGTGTTMLASVQPVGLADTPLNVTGVPPG